MIKVTSQSIFDKDNYTGPYEVRKDGKLLFVGPNSDCFEFILKNTSSSVQHAMEFEGWTITPKGADWRDDYVWYG